MRCKLILSFLILFVLQTVTAADIAQTQTIGNFEWAQDSDLNNALRLKDYFSSTAELRYRYDIVAPTTSISPVDIEISSDSDGDVNFKSPDPNFIGGKYIAFMAYEYSNESNNLTSNTVLLNKTREIPEQAQELEKILNLISVSPLQDTINIAQGDTQSFGITLESSGNETIKWYINNELTNGSNERTFLYTPENVGTFSVKVLVELSELSAQHIWTLTVSEKASPTSPTEGSSSFIGNNPECGNQIKEEGEDCQSCPQDVKCASNAECQNSICVPLQQTAASSGSLLTIVIIIVFLGIAGFSVFFIYKKGFFNKYKKSKDEPKKDSKGEITQKLDISVLKDYLMENMKKGFSLEDLKKAAMGRGWSEGQINSALSIIPQSNIEPLKNYIKENLKKGYSEEQLEKTTVDAGWTKPQVEQAFREIKNDNTQGNTPSNRKVN